MTTKKTHGTSTDFKEGELLFQLMDGTTAIYNIAGLKDASGKIVPIVDDTRATPRRWEAKGADYLNNFAANEGFPADFIQQCVATGTNAVVNPAGTGAVLIAKANLTATMADSTITAVTPVTAFGGGGSVTPVVPGPVVPGPVVPGQPNPKDETAEEKKKRLAAEKEVAGMSKGTIALIVGGVVALGIAIWAFVAKPWK